jgi:peptidyl-prolyl cis-trans isomerase A (cyclophilin A)
MKAVRLFLFFSLLTNLTFAQSLKHGVYARISTTKGKILLMLEVEKAPMTSANFVALAEGNASIKGKQIKAPFYNGIKFHRVIKDFMIQGGDSTGTGSGDPGYKFYDEFHPDLKHDRAGVLSMANSGPHTNGSQFFITHVKTPWLDNKHSVFGHVVEGQNVVDAIQQNDVIDSVTILRIGKEYKKYNPSEVFVKKHAEIELKINELKRQLEQAKTLSQEDYKKFFFEEVNSKIKNQRKERTLIQKITGVFQAKPILIQTASGLVYLVQNHGDTTKMTKGKTISMHYVGNLFIGDKFDSSRDRNEPFDIKYKEQSLIPGFEEGLTLVGKSGRVILYIPYFLGYGAKGAGGVIPAYSDLIFDVEVLDIH